MPFLIPTGLTTDLALSPLSADSIIGYLVLVHAENFTAFVAYSAVSLRFIYLFLLIYRDIHVY